MSRYEKRSRRPLSFVMWICPWNHVLDGTLITQEEWAILGLFDPMIAIERFTRMRAGDAACRQITLTTCCCYYYYYYYYYYYCSCCSCCCCCCCCCFILFLLAP